VHAVFYFVCLKDRNNIGCSEERKYLVKRKRESCKKARQTLYIYFLWRKWKARAFSFAELFYSVSLAEIEKICSHPAPQLLHLALRCAKMTSSELAASFASALSLARRKAALPRSEVSGDFAA